MRASIDTWNRNANEYYSDPYRVQLDPMPDGIYGQRDHPNVVSPPLSNTEHADIPWTQVSYRMFLTMLVVLEKADDELRQHQ